MDYQLLQKGLNKRQADLVGYLYTKPINKITLKDYYEKHKIVRQTASKDLNELVKLGLLAENKLTKSIKFYISSSQICKQLC